MFASLVFTIGAITMGAAPNKEVLLVGRSVQFYYLDLYLIIIRIIVGMGIGVASMSVPVYMAETSPESIRGFLGASFQAKNCVNDLNYHNYRYHVV